MIRVMGWGSGVVSVMFVGILSIIAFSHLFTLMQLFAALLTVPIATTLAEAYSPHTWDSPFIYGVAGVLLIAIVSFL